MTGTRYDFVPEPLWRYLGPAERGLDIDVANLETGGGGGGGTDITIRQNPDGSWPTITRADGIHYRWLCAYDATLWPIPANGAAPGDELIGSDDSVIP